MSIDYFSFGIWVLSMSMSIAGLHLEFWCIDPWKRCIGLRYIQYKYIYIYIQYCYAILHGPHSPNFCQCALPMINGKRFLNTTQLFLTKLTNSWNLVPWRYDPDPGCLVEHWCSGGAALSLDSQSKCTLFQVADFRLKSTQLVTCMFFWFNTQANTYEIHNGCRCQVRLPSSTRHMS